MLKRKLLFVLTIVVLLAMTILPNSCITAAAESSYYVSTTGNDANPGTQAAPWRTVQKAANTLNPGDTVFIMGGTYNEKVVVNVSGTATGGYITFRNFDASPVVLEGTGIAGDDMFLIKDKNYIKVIGLKLCNNNSTTAKQFPKGIAIWNTGSYIEVRNCEVYNITCPGKRSGAHGIAVYGKDGNTSINNIIIDGNEVRNCRLGWSESLVLNGNVEKFQVTNNKIHDNDNIGIDFIGYEGECPNVAVDRARDGVCSGNLVYNIDALGNPAYGTDRCADGIYVDGGTNILIEKNICHHDNIGIELASEHSGKTTSYITVRNNLVYDSHTMGIAFGGYDTRRGSTIGCQIVNNTLYNNDTDSSGSGELVIQYDVQNNTIKNNIIYAGPQNLFISNIFTNNIGSVVDYNIYYSTNPSTAKWQWKNVTYTGFSSYQKGSGNDAASKFADPLFINTASSDLHLQLSSPAINAGDPSFIPASGETDLDGNARVLNNRVDCGAYEMN